MYFCEGFQESGCLLLNVCPCKCLSIIPACFISPPAAPREILDSSKQPLSTTLHYADMKSCQEAAEHVKTVSSINVHQLTMRHELSHELELFLDRGGLKSLWKVLFSQSSSKLTCGLLGLTLGSNFTVWLKIPTHVRDRTSGAYHKCVQNKGYWYVCLFSTVYYVFLKCT